jgi:hypothetical protein
VKFFGYVIRRLAADVDIENGCIRQIVLNDRKRIMRVHARADPTPELTQEVCDREIDNSLILQQEHPHAVQRRLV